MAGAQTEVMRAIIFKMCTCGGDPEHDFQNCEASKMHAKVKGFMALRGVADESVSTRRVRDLAVVRDLLWSDFRHSMEEMGLSWSGYQLPTILPGVDRDQLAWEEGPEEWVYSLPASVTYFLEMRGLFAEPVNNSTIGVYEK